MERITGKQFKVISRFNEYCVPKGYQILNVKVDNKTHSGDISEYWITVNSCNEKEIIRYIFTDENNSLIMQRVVLLNGEWTYSEKYEATEMHYYNSWLHE